MESLCRGFFHVKEKTRKKDKKKISLKREERKNMKKKTLIMIALLLCSIFMCGSRVAAETTVAKPEICIIDDSDDNEIRGYVTNHISNGISEVWINGAAVPLNEDGSFAETVLQDGEYRVLAKNGRGETVCVANVRIPDHESLIVRYHLFRAGLFAVVLGALLVSYGECLWKWREGNPSETRRIVFCFVTGAIAIICGILMIILQFLLV